MRSRSFLAYVLLSALAACGGATIQAGAEEDREEEPGKVPARNRPERTDEAPPRDLSEPCDYDEPPPPNPGACPASFEDVCGVAAKAFPCPHEGFTCWYANVGDESSPGCYAHGMMKCVEWPDGDGGFVIVPACGR